MMDSDTHVLNPAWPTGITLCGRQVRADELVTVTPTCKGCRRILKSPPSRPSSRRWVLTALSRSPRSPSTSPRVPEVSARPSNAWGSQCRGERTSRGLERTEREFSIRRCGDGRRHGRTGSRRNDNTAQLAPLNLPQSRARSRPFVPFVRPWSLPLTKPRHLQLTDPWGGRERSARHCPSGRPDRGEGLGRSVSASRAARSEWGRALHPRTFPRPSLAILRGRFHPRPVQKQDSGARVGRCYEFAADRRAAGDGVSSPWSSTSKASGWSCRPGPRRERRDGARGEAGARWVRSSSGNVAENESDVGGLT